MPEPLIIREAALGSCGAASPLSIRAVPVRQGYGWSGIRFNKELQKMRFLGLVRTAEGQGAPPQRLMEAMGTFIESSLKNGSLVQTGGLAPRSAAVVIRQSEGRLSSSDGPFAETKEVVGGYAILEAPSRDAAVEMMRRFMELHEQHWPAWEGECELREMVFVTP